MNFKSALDSKGLSLIEVMIGSALLGGVALTGAQLFQGRYKQDANVDSMADLEVFHQNLQKQLEDVANCNATFKDWYALSAVPSSGAGISDIYLCATNCAYSASQQANTVDRVGSAGNAFVSKGRTYPNSEKQWVSPKKSWRVWDIGMKRVSRSGRHSLGVSYESNPKFGKSKKVIRTLYVTLNFDSSFLFRSCGSAQEANISSLSQAMCEAIEANTSGSSSSSVGNPNPVVVWNNGYKRCWIQFPAVNKSKVECASGWNDGDYVRGIRSDGKFLCESLTKDVDANSLIDPSDTTCGATQRPSPAYNPTTKKLYIECI